MMGGQAFREGYAKGYEDGKHGKSRDPRPPIVRSVVLPDGFMRDYMAGYGDGYSTGCKDRMRIYC